MADVDDTAVGTPLLRNAFQRKNHSPRPKTKASSPVGPRCCLSLVAFCILYLHSTRHSKRPSQCRGLSQIQEWEDFLGAHPGRAFWPRIPGPAYSESKSPILFSNRIGSPAPKTETVLDSAGQTKIHAEISDNRLLPSAAAAARQQLARVQRRRASVRSRRRRCYEGYARYTGRSCGVR